MTKILVVGGAGYIGSHVCKALAEAGYEPVTFDDLSAGHDWAVKWGPLERGDLCDAARIREAVRLHRPAGAVHLAALLNVGESVREPGRYWRNNVTGTLNLCEALTDADVPAFVFSSSCTVYAPTDAPTLNEDLPTGAISPYGSTKRAVETMLGDYEGATGMRSAVLRYFNAAGADADGEIGEDHDPEIHLIPLSLAAAAGDRAALSIFGTDYPTPDGTCIRDYIHVTDLADAHVRAIRYLLDGGASQVLNLGVGRGHSVREVVDAAGRAAGRPVPTVETPRRPGDAPRLVADASRAADVLGWTPVHSALDNIVETAWSWYEAHIHRRGT